MLKKKRSLAIGKRKDLIFYICILALPITQFMIFYIGVNLNSILLTFQKISTYDRTVTWTTNTLTETFKMMTSNQTMLIIAKNSVLSWFLISFIGTALGLLFSYYIYKKMPLSSTFRVLLYLPSIISSIVMVTIFRFFVERSIPAFFNENFGFYMSGLLENTSTRYGTIIFYNIWVGFGTNVLLYSNGMSGISQDIVDSAHLDGANGIKEFWYITLPSIYPTLTTFLITGVATIFTAQINLYSFYGKECPDDLRTYGYYMYRAIQNAGTSRAEYPQIAAMGFIMTLIAAPITMLTKYLLEKFGPSED